MFDLLECKTARFSLLRKRDGQYSKLSEESVLDLVEKQEFRGFLYELTFVADPQANENLMMSMQYLFRGEGSVAQRSGRQAELELEQKK